MAIASFSFLAARGKNKTREGVFPQNGLPAHRRGRFLRRYLCMLLRPAVKPLKFMADRLSRN